MCKESPRLQSHVQQIAYCYCNLTFPQNMCAYVIGSEEIWASN